MRDVITGESIPYNKFINKYVIKVEPHRAILEPDYFIKLIDFAEQRRDEEVNENFIFDLGLDRENRARTGVRG